MRQITQDAIDAFYGKSNFKRSNTTVEYLLQPHSETSTMYLFGNAIARLDHRTGRLTITNCGWESLTTKERLNGLHKVRINQSKGQWYLNGEAWDGSVTEMVA